jgi:hypothetical protein
MTLSKEDEEFYDKVRAAYGIPRKDYPIHLYGERLDGTMSCLIHGEIIQIQLHPKTVRKKRKNNYTLWNFMPEE